MRVILLVILFLVTVSTPGSAQLSNILQLLEDLQAQFNQLQQSLSAQNIQVETLSEQLGLLNAQWQDAQALLDRIPILDQTMGPLLEQTAGWSDVLNQVFATQQQLAPLLQQWPTVQAMIETVTSLQGSFNQQLQTLEELRHTIQALAQPQQSARVGTLEAQIAAMQQTTQERHQQQAQLTSQVNALQSWLWVALAAVAVLLAAHISGWVWSTRLKAGAA